MRIVLPEVLRAVTLRPASRRPARVRREAVTFVPDDGARCVVTGSARLAAMSGVRPCRQRWLVDNSTPPMTCRYL
jgi:SpoVK/Ycf46/Vps4 family AAA+-type ATPase